MADRVESRRAPGRARARLGLAGLVLLGVGVVLTAVGYAAGVRAAQVGGIVVLVLALAALRARAWVRKARLLGLVGRDLHVPRERGREE